MAVAELSVSRREVLGAACAAPFFRHSRAGGNPDGREEGSWIPDQVRDDEGGGRRAGQWERALARFREAEAILAAVEGADDVIFDPALGRFNGALARLLRAPAPHIAALAAKLDLLVAHEVWSSTSPNPVSQRCGGMRCGWRVRGWPAGKEAGLTGTVT